MLVQLSETLRREVEAIVRTKLGESCIVDVYATAEEIRLRHAAERNTIEEIAASVAHLATQCGCAVELGRKRRDRDAAARV